MILNIGRKIKMKIDNDKYYTPIDLAKYCIDKTFEIIGKELYFNKLPAYNIDAVYLKCSK